MKRQLVIIGASGHGKVVADIAKKNGYTEIVFLDDNDKIQECGEYQVVGTSEKSFFYKDRDFIVAIGNCKIREKIQKELEKQGMKIVTLVHPSAILGENVKLGAGTVVVAGVVINSSANIGRGCIINTCSSVDHDCVVRDFVHIAVGAHVAGTVDIGDRTWIGAGAVVSNNVAITSDCMIGAGTAVVKDIEEIGTYMGVPARRKL